MKLTAEQVKQYYASEGQKPNPLSPLKWLEQQTKPAVKTQQVPVQTTQQAPTQIASQAPIQGTDFSLPPEEPALPTADISGLSADQVLSFALRDVARLAEREGKVTGLAATSSFFAQRDILPEDLPGSSIANMLAVVDRAMTSPVADRVSSMTDLLNAVSLQRKEMQSSTATQLKFMIDLGNWNGLIDDDPIQAQNLWDGAGFSGSPQKTAEATKGGFSAPYFNEVGQLVQVDKETGRMYVIANPDKETETTTQADYKAQLLDDVKDNNMDYKGAIAAYGSYIDRNWIDWYFLDTGANAELVKWTELAKTEPDKYVIKKDGVYKRIPWWPDKLMYAF